MASATFPFVEDYHGSTPTTTTTTQQEEEAYLTNSSFYDCPNDYDFLKLLELESFPRLEERFHWLKLKFRIVNTKCFYRQTEGGYKNIFFSDIRYYPFLLSWHFEDCPEVNFHIIPTTTTNSSDSSEPFSISSSCECAYGLKDPEEKLKRKALDLNCKKWCLDGTIFTIARIRNENFAMYRSGFVDVAIRDRFFGYGFGSDETQFSDEMRTWSLRKLRCVRNHLISRLRLVHFAKTMKRYESSSSLSRFAKDFFKLKIENGRWHVNCCNKTEYLRCDCSLAFDHPKGWFHYFCNITNMGDTGYALVQKPIFDNINIV